MSHYPDNATPADKIAKDLAAEFGVKVGSYKMAAEDSKAIADAVQLITKEMGEVRKLRVFAKDGADEARCSSISSSPTPASASTKTRTR